jgi:hypothetical protein
MRLCLKNFLGLMLWRLRKLGLNKKKHGTSDFQKPKIQVWQMSYPTTCWPCPGQDWISEARLDFGGKAG